MNAHEVLLTRMREAVARSHDMSVWPQGDAPGARQSHAVFTLEERLTGDSELDRSVTGVRAPRIVVYAPEHPNGAGILVTPGGSYLAWCSIKKAARWHPRLTTAAIRCL